MDSLLKSVQNDTQCLFGIVTNGVIVERIMWCESESVEVLGRAGESVGRRWLLEGVAAALSDR